MAAEDRAETAPAQQLPPEVARARANGLGELLRRSAARHRDKPALVDGDRRFTFAELDREVSRIAVSLQEKGFQPGDRLALVSRNCWEFVVLAWGSARAGVTLVPINFMLRAADIAYLLDDAEVSGVVAQDEFLATTGAALREMATPPGVRARIVRDASLDAEGWEDLADWFGEVPSDWEAPVTDDDAPVRIMYTSGTESRPKGALLSARSLVSQYVSCVVEGSMSGDDVELHTLPMYHCAQLDCFIGPDLMTGATSILLPAPEPGAVLEAIERHGVTKFFAPPTVWIGLLRHPSFDERDLSTLTKGYYGASAMPVEVLREIQQRLPELRLWNFYGQTEMAPLATILTPEEQVSHAGSAGRPVLNVETRVVDELDRELPVGEVGEVVHRSPHATLGYWRQPEKTAEAFRGGWFHSGDLGVMDAEGRLSIVDRKKDMIKSGGENVASREVEEAIYLHPDVAEVAVVGVPDSKWIEAVMAVVVPRPGSTLTASDLEAHCVAHLSAYKRPKRIEILQELPKNPSGKILKRDLRQRFARPT